MKRLLLATALVALSASSFAVTQNPSEICATAIPGIGYAGTLSVYSSHGGLIASTNPISLGFTRCLKVPKMLDGEAWYALDTPYGPAGGTYLGIACDYDYIYHASSSHGEAWYKMWGGLFSPKCGRAG